MPGRGQSRVPLLDRLWFVAGVLGSKRDDESVDRGDDEDGCEYHEEGGHSRAPPLRK